MLLAEGAAPCHLLPGLPSSQEASMDSMDLAYHLYQVSPPKSDGCTTLLLEEETGLLTTFHGRGAILQT